MLAIEQPAVGVMETDWAENRADIPQDIVRKTLGRFADIFFTTYQRDKFRTRVERGAEAGTVEIYIAHRGMEQVPTTKIDNSSPAAFAWALMPPNPDLEAEMLTRMMMRFGAPETQAVAAVAQSAAQPERARIEKTADGAPKLVVDESFDRAWRRVGLALDRSGFTVVDRDRSNGLYYVRYADPDADIAKKDTGWLAKLAFWKKDEAERPEQYRIAVVEAAPTQRRHRAGPEGRARRSAGERPHPRAAQGPAEVGRGRATRHAVRLARQRQRRQRPRRRGVGLAPDDRLRVRHPRHGHAPRPPRARARRPRRHPRHARAQRPRRRRAGVRREARHRGLAHLRDARPWSANASPACRSVYGFDSHDSFAVGALEVRPFPVPHDAREPVQFVVSDGDARLGVLTDLGMSTPWVEQALDGCDALVLECNHDAQMLAEGTYPAPLKARIGGRLGHLDNVAAAAIVAAIDTTRLKHIVAAHLSQQNNTPAHARAALSGALGCAGDWIGIADQALGFDWREI